MIEKIDRWLGEMNLYERVAILLARLKISALKSKNFELFSGMIRHESNVQL